MALMERYHHILEVLRFKFPYVEETSAFVGPSNQINNQGLYLFIGKDEDTAIKTDILYWDAPSRSEIKVIHV